jgi:hypothetical protein
LFKERHSRRRYQIERLHRASPSEHQGDKAVENIEQIELDAHRSQMIADVKSLVEKYRSIFDWDIPEINQGMADKLILAAIRKSLDDIEKDLL